MIDPGMVTGAVVAVGAFLAGQWLPRPHRRRRVGHPKPVQPICGCEHHFSYHDPETGACHSRGVYLGNGQYDSCGCRRYSGPEPLPEYFAPEIT